MNARITNVRADANDHTTSHHVQTRVLHRSFVCRLIVLNAHAEYVDHTFVNEKLPKINANTHMNCYYAARIIISSDRSRRLRSTKYRFDHIKLLAVHHEVYIV